MRPTRLEPILTAHPYLQVERPPLLWDVDADDEALIRALGEMISAALVRNGGVLAEITLNVSNVIVGPEAGESIPHGDYVALTIRARGDWSPEVTWQPGRTGSGLLVGADLQAAAGAAGATYGYTRILRDGEGSVTVFLPRAAGG